MIPPRQLVNNAPLDGMPEEFRRAVWEGFEAFDLALRNEGGEEILRRGFFDQQPTPYRFFDMPDWSVADFVASWPAAQARM